MKIGKSIRLYLADASVTGIRYAELVNWTGHAIACPRSKLSELQNWPEASKPGVYFLFEGRYGDAKPLAYIGESENVTERLIDHDRKKEFWSEVVIFTSKDENLTKAHIKFLESALVVIAKNANRFSLENSNTPTESSLPRADRDAMEEFTKNIKMVLGVVGYQILEPLLPNKVANITNENSLTQPETINSFNDFTFKVSGCDAHGTLTDEGFVLRSGSTICKTVSESLPNKILNMRNKCITERSLIEMNGVYELQDNLLFSSSSYAAAFVAGTSRSGPQSWKTINGKTMKDIEEEKIKIEEKSA